MAPAARSALLTIPCLVAVAALAQPAAAPPEHGNLFNDPFVQALAGLPGCPPPLGPDITPGDVRREAHVRAQHGGSCYRAGRCRLPNSYLYDAEIIPRVQLAIREDGRFGGTSIWLLGERRIVTLMGCVRSQEEGLELERLVQRVDDVMNVVNLLSVGVEAPPRYTVRP